jgi:hypothetical protein
MMFSYSGMSPGNDRPEEAQTKYAETGEKQSGFAAPGGALSQSMVAGLRIMQQAAIPVPGYA